MPVLPAGKKIIPSPLGYSEKLLKGKFMMSLLLFSCRTHSFIELEKFLEAY